jgi:hypothetical protein
MKAITLLPLFLAGTNALANNAPSDFHLNQQQLQKQKQDCTKACAQDDLDCRAICDHAPHPKPIHMNLMTECVHHCDVLKGKGSAAEITSYNQCHNSCINGYMALGEKKAPETKTWVDLVTPTPVIAVQETGNAEVSFEASGVSEASGKLYTSFYYYPLNKLIYYFSDAFTTG